MHVKSAQPKLRTPAAIHSIHEGTWYRPGTEGGTGKSAGTGKGTGKGKGKGKGRAHTAGRGGRKPSIQRNQSAGADFLRPRGVDGTTGSNGGFSSSTSGSFASPLTAPASSASSPNAASLRQRFGRRLPGMNIDDLEVRSHVYSGVLADTRPETPSGETQRREAAEAGRGPSPSMSRGSSTAESRRRVAEMHVTEEARGLDLLPAKQGIVDGYMRSYANERRQFASFQYFAEKQLNEAFRMTEYDTLPSSFRTAVVVDLLGCLGQLFVRFESPFTELYQEVLRSVYTEYDGTGFIEQNGGLPGLVHAPTYASMNRELRSELVLMREREAYMGKTVAELRQRMQIGNEGLTRLKIGMQFIRKEWTGRYAGIIFRMWKGLLVHTQHDRKMNHKRMSIWFNAWKRGIRDRRRTHQMMSLNAQLREAAEQIEELAWQRDTAAARMEEMAKELEELRPKKVDIRREAVREAVQQGGDKRTIKSVYADWKKKEAASLKDRLDAAEKERDELLQRLLLCSCRGLGKPPTAEAEVQTNSRWAKLDVDAEAAAEAARIAALASQARNPRDTQTGPTGPTGPTACSNCGCDPFDSLGSAGSVDPLREPSVSNGSVGGRGGGRGGDGSGDGSGSGGRGGNSGGGRGGGTRPSSGGSNGGKRRKRRPGSSGGGKGRRLKRQNGVTRHKPAPLSVPHLLEMISTIYSKKVMSDAIDEICETDPQHLPEFVEDSIIQSYGVGPLAAKRLADMYAGVKRHMARHPRIRLFALISGIQDNGAAYGGKASKVFIKFISKACLDSHHRSTGHSAASEYTGPGSAARRVSSAALAGAGRPGSPGSPGGAGKGEAGGRRRSPMSVFEDDTRHAAAKMVSHAIQSCFSKTASKVMLHRRSILKSVAASLDGEMPRAAIQSVLKRLDGITEGMNSSSGAGGGCRRW